MIPLFVGIAGGSGSGKTTVVRALRSRFGAAQIAVIEHDSYYAAGPNLNSHDRKRINYDHPSSLDTNLLAAHLNQLREGDSVEVPVYDFTRHQRTNRTRPVFPAQVIIVEGILVLAAEPLSDLLDLRVFIETADDIRFIRRLRRDVDERGRSSQSVIDQYLSSVRPMHRKYVQPSAATADLVLSGEVAVEECLPALTRRVEQFLATQGVVQES